MSVRVSLPPAIVEMLNELAGGERHKSEYLTRTIPILHRANQRAALTRLKEQAQVLEEALAVEILSDDQK